MLNLVREGPARDRAAAICLVSCVKNERRLIEPFFEHYRGLGVRDFVLVDNGSTDGTAAWLAAQDDCTLYACTADFAAARGGMDWIEVLLRRHAAGRWGLYADCDEHLVYPYADRTDVEGFVRDLERQGFDACRAVMIDMYSGDRLGVRPEEGLSLRDQYDLFDADYVVRRIPARPWAPRRRTALQVLGGPRLRLLSDLAREEGGAWVRPMALGQIDRLLPHVPEALLPALFRAWPPCLPALHKQPLNKIGDDFAYSTAHDGSNERVAPTLTALLHYKFVGELERCARSDGALQTQYHRRGLEREQLRLAVRRNGDKPITYLGTRRYRSWYDLAAEGLIGERWAPVIAPDPLRAPATQGGGLVPLPGLPS